MSNKDPSQTPAWKALQGHQKTLQNMHMRDLFSADRWRFEKFHIKVDGLLLDYSKHRITEETLAMLTDLAEMREVEELTEELFTGAALNTSENRAALHTALRSPSGKAEIDDFVAETLEKIKQASEKIREGGFEAVVNIGIGGAELGPRMVCEALASFADGPKIYFVSNVDSDNLDDVLKGLRPDKTLIIVSSKTFGTLETMTNAHSAREWTGGRMNNFMAVTANAAAAKAFGVASANILPLKEWIGGRYSLWSAAGLCIAVSIGFENFQKLLEGARAMDTHFHEAPFEKNMPVILALLGIWYRNFWDFRAHAILPYAHRLRRLPDFLQQLEMESNGKSVSRNGAPLSYPTAAAIFGGEGTNSQHAFLQLLHQGSDIIPCDFIVTAAPSRGRKDHHIKLTANALAQAQALMQGTDDKVPAHQTFPGNRPSSTLLLTRLDPYHLGLLLALYEHKVFVQGAIWGINSFDQWGVELGKTLAKQTIEDLSDATAPAPDDSSTAGLLALIRAHL